MTVAYPAYDLKPRAFPSLLTVADAIQDARDLLDLIAFAAEGLEDRASAITSGCNAARGKIEQALRALEAVRAEVKQ